MSHIPPSRAGKPTLFEVLIGQDAIARRVEELGRAISEDYHDKQPVLVGVLKGCIVFLADLIRHLTCPIELEFVSAASYRTGVTPTEGIVIDTLFSRNLAGRDIIVVEGIVDTGRTATIITNQLKQMEPASLALVTLLDKPGSHRADLEIKYKGFTIGNEFVIGYGMDNTQQYRNLPYIGRFPEN